MFAISAAPALAWARPGRGVGRKKLHAVPEIDASAGLLAIAAVLVILAFVWERNRRMA
ncbi:MAG: VPEID-CTERM sorting domain-containing protein [Tabrizicola sp.]|nr:VPEID-CTERM sorting domain-containing protein [Tabrizicola sp.]